jgi:pSer/pThr/pTyr-binding forkhead associated (FHA) protein
MPKLILQFEEVTVKEVPVGQAVTIGRLPGNSLVIDGPIVSSRHARVVRDGDDFVVEDLKSTNGTFVNRHRVTRHRLRDGDVMVVGKHRLVFNRAGGDDAAAPEPDAEAEAVDADGTVALDDERRLELLAEVAARSRPKARTGALRVLAGKSDRPDYTLGGESSLIGRSDAALVRLKGWFEPKTALAIARAGERYTAISLGGKNLVNGQPLNGRQDLKEGDVLQVGGLTLEFQLRD